MARASAGAGGIPIHLHLGTVEAFYVVAGELGLWLDDRRVLRPSGSYTVVPPGRRHSFWNPGDRPARYLTVISPSGLERYFVELASGLQHVATDEDAAALRKRLGTLLDITVVGPPS